MTKKVDKLATAIAEFLAENTPEWHEGYVWPESEAKILAKLFVSVGHDKTVLAVLKSAKT